MSRVACAANHRAVAQGILKHIFEKVAVERGFFHHIQSAAL
ncbi:hypothetical protein [Phormidium tenue]|nr:hypothetical protein [Phormidium tenue]